MKLRKFDDFKRIYENNPGLMMGPDSTAQLPTSSPSPVKEPDKIKEKPPVREVPPPPKRQIDPDRIEQPSKDPQRKAGYSEEEEESDMSEIDAMVEELAGKLGAELVDNIIHYQGPSGATYDIEFQSDPMCFAVNKKTLKFLTTVEEVIEYIDSEEEQAGPAQAQPTKRPGQRFGAQSQKLPTGPAQAANERKHNHSYKNRYR